MRFRTLAGFIPAIFLLSVLVTGVADLDRASADEPKSGGALNMVLFPEPPMITSAFNSSTYVGVVSTKVHDGLLTYEFDMTPRPSLATEWNVSDDGLTYTFKLREGVKWHDGEPFTAEDVKFSLLNVWKELHPRGRTTYANVTGVETPNDHTVVIKLSQPSPTLMSSLSSYESQIIPKHVYDGSEITENAALSAPIGTGPFKFTEWEKGNYIILDKNPDYWDQPKPYLDRILIRFIPDGAARAAAIETGEADYGAFTPVPMNDVVRLDELPNVSVETLGYEYLSPIFLLELNHRNEYLANPKVRQAISHAVDRQFAADNIWFGYAKPATGPVPSSLVSFYTPDVPDTVSYDPELANKLLDEAGYPRGSDGVRFPLRLEVAAAGETFTRMGEYLRQALSKVGIDVELRNIDLGGFIKRVYTDLDFDMTMNFIYSMPDPTIGVQRLYWSDNIKPGVPFHNVSSYSNPELDTILEQAQVEPDADKRRELWHEAQRIIARDVPVVDVVELRFATIHNDKVKNHTTGAEGPYESFADVYLAD